MTTTARASVPEQVGCIAAPVEDERLLETVEGIAQSLLRRGEQHRGRSLRARKTYGTPADRTRTEDLTINDTQYRIRAERLLDALDQPVILVLVERCPRKYPSPHALRERFGLTPSEARVALLLADRKCNREIAEELEVTEHTARRHTEKVLLKLDIHRRMEVRGAMLR